MTSQQSSAISVLKQLEEVLMQLNSIEYQSSLEVLSGNSIGKHVRHVLEFYQVLISGYINGIIDYDKRERDLLMETDICYAINVLHSINSNLCELSDKALILITNHNEERQQNNTSFLREVIYNMEHSIHHMAIIRIAIQAERIRIDLPHDFGVAHSTVKHKEALCAQ